MGWGRSAGKRAHVSVRLESDRHDTQSVPLIWRGTSADTSPQSAKAPGFCLTARGQLRSAPRWCASGTPAPCLRSETSGGGREEERSPTPGPLLDTMSLLKQRGRELERFDGLSLIYWYVNSSYPRCARVGLGGTQESAQILWNVASPNRLHLAHMAHARTRSISLDAIDGMSLMKNWSASTKDVSYLCAHFGFARLN